MSTLTLLSPPARSPVSDPAVIGTATLVLLLSPLRGADGALRVVRQAVAAGQPLATVLPVQQAWSRVILNGRSLTPDEHTTWVLAPGDEVLAIPQWGVESGLLLSALITIAIGVAVSVAVTALTYLLFPPAKPHTQGPLDEPTFSFEGIRTAIGPGSVVPVIYGRHRVGGQLLSASVDQAMTVVDVDASAASTPVAHAIDNVYGGEQSADGTVNTPITVVANDHGATTGAHVDIGGVTGKTAANGGWYVTVLDIHTVQLNSSEGIDARPYTGGGILVLVAQAAAPTRRVTAIAQPPTLSLLLAIGEGPIGAILTNTLEINGQPLGNFPNVLVYVRNGEAAQTAIPEFGETSNSFADGRQIPTDPGITYTTTAAVEAFALNIAFQEGLFYMTSTGDKQENVATVSYRYRVSPAGAWTAFSTYEIAAARTAVVRLGIRREGVPLAVYDIHVEFSHAREMNETRAKWTPTLESVTEIVHNTQAYANTALLGLRAVATDALQGALPNITVEVLGRNVRLNQFEQVLNYSSDPAWCVMDFLTHPRYGLGIADADIDLGAFNAWSSYNNEIVDGEVRHHLNYVLDRDARAQQVLMEMMGGSRTILFKSEGLWTPRPTRDQTPVQLLSWTSCANLQLTYTRDPDQINVMEARYSNEEDQFQQDILTWPTIANWPADVRKASLDIRGVTKPSRIMRALQFELNRRRFEVLSLEVDCSLDAIVLQPHDLFRFAHPLPGWGVSGRILAGSTTTTVFLDAPVTFTAGPTYHLYVRHEDDTVEIRDVNFPGVGTVQAVTLATALGQAPVARNSTYAFGESSPDTAVKLFRVVTMQRKSDTTVHLKAIAHNPSIYDDITATALPVISSLFNPLGPSPPIISLILTEVTRIQASGASLRVVNLSWDIAALSPGFGPYGGAMLLRRTVLESGLAGVAQAGVVDLGAIQDASDANVNFVPLAQVRGHVLDFDDYTVLTGVTYIYRVVPLSQRGVPNNTGAREGLIHVAGPTTPGFFPGTVRNLRLKGQNVGATQFEGRDVHVEWDPVAESPLFTQTFFVQDYLVEVWAPGQQYLLRRTSVLARLPGEAIQWTYTLEQNAEDQIRSGMGGARRDVWIFVWARTNTSRVSLDAAILAVTNPPPDMGDLIPGVQPLFQAGLIDFTQFAEPRDFSHYEVYLDTVNPPVALYQDVSIAFRKLFPANLLPNVTYYVFILPFDTFGPGIPSQIASFTPVALTADFLDTAPPGTPTGLVLTTGVDLSADGTSMSWVRASWGLAPEEDVAGYEVHVFVDDSTVPTVYTPQRSQHAIQIPVPGNVPITIRLLAFDRFHNLSAFTADAVITAARDTTPPAAPANLTAVGSIRAVALLWTPPPDGDYAFSEIWAAPVNNRASAVVVGTGRTSFVHEGLGATDTRYYWIRAVDTSGNASAGYHPGSAIGGVVGTAGQLDTTFISSLAATKLIAGTITALVRLGVNNIIMDGVNNLITIFDSQNTPVPRVYLGKLGTLNTAYGLQVFNSSGQLMWHFTDGAQTAGISDASITATKIAAAVVTASHLRTDTAVVTVAAQIANALITDAHMINVSATKIITGSLQAVYTVGVGTRIVLDGPNTLMTIFDNQNTPAPRVYLGKVGAANTDYGLQVWSDTGQLMWDFTSGVQTRGLGALAVTTPKVDNFAVTTPKIGLAAVSESLLYSSATVISSSGTETVVASLTFPLLNQGDVVLFLTQGIGISGGANTLTLRIREDNLSGNILNSTSESNAGAATSMALNAYYQTPSALSNKTYFLTVNQTTGSGGVSVSDVSFIAVRLQR